MGTLLIAVLAVVFSGLVTSLVVLYISEEKGMIGFEENGCVEPLGEETTSYDKRLENFIIEERSKNIGTSKQVKTEDYEPVVGTFSNSSISNSMLSNFSEGRRHENLMLSLN